MSVEVKNLSINFVSQGRIFEAVKHVSLQLEKGRTLALIGESGSGKSVTALSILQLLGQNATYPSGEVLIDGQNIINGDVNYLRGIRGNKISMIFQEPMTSLNPLHTIEKQIAEPLLLHKGMSKLKAKERVLELLDLVGLPMLKNRLGAFPHELSGGQRQRVMIAMALANDPDVLIADEPTTALDVTVQAQILELLKDLQQKLGMAILLITHDFGVVKKIAHDVCVMKKGEIVEAGTLQDVFKNPQHSYTKMLLDSEPSGEALPFDEEASPILLAKNLKVYFPNAKNLFGKPTSFVKAVDDVDVRLRPGETLGIVGESGSGKTTTAMALLKLQDSQGVIDFDGINLNKISTKALRALRSDFQVIFQDPYGALSPRMTIEQIVEEGLLIHEKELSKQAREKAIIAILQKVGIDPATRHRYPHEFSGGQRQRIAIARAMILKPKVVVLDEPTSALDLSVQKQIIDLLRDLQRDFNLSYIFISHDLKVVQAMSHSVLVMKDGKIVEMGTTQEIFNDPKQLYTQHLMKAAFDV